MTNSYYWLIFFEKFSHHWVLGPLLFDLALPNQLNLMEFSQESESLLISFPNFLAGFPTNYGLICVSTIM